MTIKIALAKNGEKIMFVKTVCNISMKQGNLVILQP